jgi:hypothetical protein
MKMQIKIGCLLEMKGICCKEIHIDKHYILIYAIIVYMSNIHFINAAKHLDRELLTIKDINQRQWWILKFNVCKAKRFSKY